ncbi:hypothetical protein TcCL_NonESM07108 [Trypanosoma cruzi]|nr:hypothetical protein TcCL_NonESM07108 [Trypanosoma cruzi]
MNARTRFWLLRPLRWGMKGVCNACLSRALLRVPEVGAERFPPSSYRCRSVFLVVYLTAGAFPAVRGDVCRRRSGCGGGDNSGTTGGSAWAAEGGCALLPPAGYFMFGRRLVCADAWQKRPPWLLLVVVVAVCSGAAIFLLLFRVSVCVSCCCWE